MMMSNDQPTSDLPGAVVPSRTPPAPERALVVTAGASPCGTCGGKEGMKFSRTAKKEKRTTEAPGAGGRGGGGRRRNRRGDSIGDERGIVAGALGIFLGVCCEV